MVLLTTHHEFVEVESEVADVGLALADGDGARRRRRRREVRRVLAVRPPARRCRSRNTQKNEQWTKGLTFKIGVGLSFLFDDIGEPACQTHLCPLINFEWNCHVESRAAEHQ